jgi:hypothetical protein
MLPLFVDGKLTLEPAAKLLNCPATEVLDRLSALACSSHEQPGHYASLWVLAIAIQTSGTFPKGKNYDTLREHCERWGPSFIASGLFDVGKPTKALYDGELRITPSYLPKLLNHVRLVSEDGYVATNPGALLIEVGLWPADVTPIQCFNQMHK